MKEKNNVIEMVGRVKPLSGKQSPSRIKFLERKTKP